MCRKHGFLIPETQRSGPFTAVLLSRRTASGWIQASAGDMDIGHVVALSPKLQPSSSKYLPSCTKAWVKSLRIKQAFQFPASLYDYLRRPNHPYDVFNVPADGSSNTPDFETGALLTLLEEHFRSNRRSRGRTPRVLFVHVNAISRLHHYPGLVESRRDCASLQFFTYGTDPTIPPERWGVREIFPIGLSQASIMFSNLTSRRRCSHVHFRRIQRPFE